MAFAVKATTLMLILGGIAAVTYAGIGIAGFYGFFAIFVGAFTKLRLWDFLNVNYPKDDPALLSQVSLVAFAIGALLLGYAIHKNRSSAVRTVGIPLLAFCAFVGVGFAPWIGKNVSEAVAYHNKIGIGALLNGSPFPVPTDIKSARPAAEVAAINAEYAKEELIAKDAGKTVNEDL